ncbi:MAG: tRNA (N(6)-L-threonylcarbamoyladenosine(37)-C(2))-methylthiotransferase MtaB [Deltaproteobacteria bacterium]|nr:tRNA (N(6)-L-threonylcarbamoyladenosine(37)-C(2))-methylthiotransferase MtaB [Deltaproteobacteria bacterium]
MAVYFATLGCRLNEAEVADWRRKLLQRGHRLAADVSQADVAVLNTCAVTGEAARKSRKATRRLHRQNPRAKLVLTGCFAALEPTAAAELAGVDLVVANSEKDQLIDRLLAIAEPALPRAAMERTTSHLHAAVRTRAFVKVQDGCRHRCSFCIVTVARGAERSRPIDTVIEQVNALHDEGYNEVVLSGVHLGGYGADLTPKHDLSALCEALLRRTRVPRLRLSSLEPWELSPRLFELFGDRRLCPHLHLAAQSGSDRILRLMARRNTVDEYRRLVERAHQQISDLTVTSDLIVGFPSETEEDFAMSLDLVRHCEFADVHIFAYSPRPQTVAARLQPLVSEQDKRRRSQRLHQVAAEYRQRILRQQLGRQSAVLWETIDEHAWGYTDNYLRVCAHPVKLAINRITTTRLVDLDPRGNTLLGEPCHTDS